LNVQVSSLTIGHRLKRRGMRGIILFVGDNLGDFSNDFDERTSNYAFSVVDEQKDQFGSRYIILPNPMYGSWEKGVLVGDGSSKSQQRRDHVLGFECSDD